MKSKEAAGVLAIFLGGVGAHKFYLGKYALGVAYLLFCWTYIPSLIGIIEGIRYLLMDNETFQEKCSDTEIVKEYAPLSKGQLTGINEERIIQITNIDQDCLKLPNYIKYAEYTKKHDWKSICELNNVLYHTFGTKKELKVLANYLEEEEVVFALASGMMKQTETSNITDLGPNTWIVVLTNERFLFLDHAMLTISVDTQSVRHNHVQAVSASQGFGLGKIQIDLGARVITIDNCTKESVSVMANLANKWLRILENKISNTKTSSTHAIAFSASDEIKKLAELHGNGILTDEEFNNSKNKIINKI